MIDNGTAGYLLDAIRGCAKATRLAARGAKRVARRRAFIAVEPMKIGRRGEDAEKRKRLARAFSCALPLELITYDFTKYSSSDTEDMK